MNEAIGRTVEASAMPKRTRITVIGLRKGQHRVVADKCGKLADLAFLDGDTSSVALPASDHIVVMTKFVEHRWTEAAHQRLGRERVHLHRGGISGLAKIIGEIAC
jgi:hypothetical protein